MSKPSDHRPSEASPSAGQPSQTKPMAPSDQRDALEASERRANAQQPRNFKDDALTEKVVSVEPDGTGPTPTESFDTDEDKRRGSGSGQPD